VTGMRFFTKMPLMLIGAVLVACASSSTTGAGATVISQTFRFTDVKSVFVETPVEVRLRGGAGGDMRSLENTVADALREHFRQEFGWITARTSADADLSARFELTDWESGNEGTRVGGSVTLVSPTGEQVFSSTAVYPSRFGAGAPGPQLENLPNLFRTLLKPVKDMRQK
jgi:hypothetical protein